MIAARRNVPIFGLFAIATVGKGRFGLEFEKGEIGGGFRGHELVAFKGKPAFSFCRALSVKRFRDLLAGCQKVKGIEGIAAVDDAVRIFLVTLGVTKALKGRTIRVSRQLAIGELVVVLTGEFMTGSVNPAKETRFVAVAATLRAKVDRLGCDEERGAAKS